MTPTDLSPLRALETEWRETAAGLMALTEANAAQATSAELLVLWRLEARRTTECADALARCLDTLGETEPKGALYPQADRDVQSLVEHVACDFERRGIGECETCDWIRTFLKREIRVPTQARKP